MIRLGLTYTLVAFETRFRYLGRIQIAKLYDIRVIVAHSNYHLPQVETTC